MVWRLIVGVCVFVLAWDWAHEWAPDVLPSIEEVASNAMDRVANRYGYVKMIEMDKETRAVPEKSKTAFPALNKLVDGNLRIKKHGIDGRFEDLAAATSRLSSHKVVTPRSRDQAPEEDRTARGLWRMVATVVFLRACGFWSGVALMKCSARNTTLDIPAQAIHSTNTPNTSAKARVEAVCSGPDEDEEPPQRLTSPVARIHQ
ncbi:hypothetical protein MTO96_018604 [Rhipicephalus appendiculatus]